MTVTWLDRIKNYVLTAHINWRHPVTRAEHDRQRDLVRAAEQLSPDRTERHATYARRPPVVRHIGGGWKIGHVTPPRTTER